MEKEPVTRPFEGPLLIAFAAFLWGVDGVIRRSLYALPPIVIVFYEHVIGLAILLPFFVAARKDRFRKIEWSALGFVALLSSVLGTLWFTAALLQTNYISFSVVFLLQKLQPVFAIAGAVFILKEKVSRKYIFWAVLAIMAAYFVTFPNGHVNLTAGRGTVIAALLAVGAAFAWGFTTPVSRYTLLGHSPTAVTGWRFFFAIIFSAIIFGIMVIRGAVPAGALAIGSPRAILGFILGAIAIGALGFSIGRAIPRRFMKFASWIVAAFTLVLLGWYFGAGTGTWFAHLNRSLLAVLLIGLSSGMVSLWIYYRGLKFTKASVATILELISPLTAVLIDYFYFHNALAASQYIAGAVLIYSTWRISRLNNAA